MSINMTVSDKTFRYPWKPEASTKLDSLISIMGCSPIKWCVMSSEKRKVYVIMMCMCTCVWPQLEAGIFSGILEVMGFPLGFQQDGNQFHFSLRERDGTGRDGGGATGVSRMGIGITIHRFYRKIFSFNMNNCSIL